MNNGYLYITDYVLPNLGRDVADEIQRVIENNPNRTIFSPMGNISFPIPSAPPPIPYAASIFSFRLTLPSARWTAGIMTRR